MKRIQLTICAMLCMVATYAQTTYFFSTGTTFVNSNPANVATYSAGFFINDGTYTDNAGTTNVNGGITFSGTGTTTMYDLNFNSGSSLINTVVSVLHTANITGGNLDANNNLYIRSDLSPLANLVITGVLTNPVQGIIAKATTVIGGCPSYSSTLSTNVSGPVVNYQWESSPDNTTWAAVAGATNATYAATVTSTIYYRCDLSTSNSSFTDTTSGVLLNFTGAPPAGITGTASVCQGATTILSNATSGGTWSSASTGVATVGSATGVVTAVGPGTSIITYSTGCAPDVTLTVTVNALPTPTFDFAPGANVCSGVSVTYTTQSGGGINNYIWNVPGVAGTNYTIISGGIGTSDPTVTLQWLTTGSKTVTVNYSTASGCAGASPASNTTSVNATPVAITASNVCLGGTATESDGTGGGLWTASNGNVLIGSTSGIVTGVTTGTVTVIYTMPAGCSASAAITVNSLPSSIGGTPTVCTGAITVFSDAGGGTWTSSDNSKATVDASGNVTGVATGTSNITYTLSTGCFTTQAVTVNQTPTPILGTLTVCAGATTTLGDATGSGTWSSGTPATATIGSGSGTVTGGAVVSASTSIITYALASGCSVTATVTVNPAPGSITGTATVCQGSVTTLADAGGGTWSSSDNTKATVDGSGNVTGVAAGTSTITYTLAGGCFATRPITVNPIPANITGTPVVCEGSTTTLANAVSGGTWSSSVTSVATVGSTGIVTGVLGSPSTSVITYTLPAGCNTSVTVTVNPAPGVIDGTTTVCVGLTTTLNSTPAGGAWSSSNTSQATVGTSGIVTGVAAGTPTIFYTLPAGCTITKIVTVNALPGAITGAHTVCVNATTTLADGISGGAWSSSNGTLATVGSTGIVTGVAAGNLSIIYTLPTTCLASYTLTVNDIPAVQTITGGGVYCAGSAAPHVLISGSVSGTDYQLYNDGSPSGSPVGGGGSGFDFGAQSASGIYTAVATIAATGCTIPMTGSATVLATPLPTVSAGSDVTICPGSSTPLTASGATTYSWSPSTGLSCTTCVSPTASPTVTTTYTVTGSSSSALVYNQSFTGGVAPTTQCTAWSAFRASLLGSYTYTGFRIRGSADPVGITCTDPSIATAVADALLNGTNYDATSDGQNWHVGTGCSIGAPGCGAPVAVELSNQGDCICSFGYALRPAINYVNWGGINGLTCGSVSQSMEVDFFITPACSSTAVVTVGINPVPTAFSVTGTGGYCVGGTGVLVGLSNSEVGVSYQLFNGGAVGSPVAGTGSAISFGLHTAGTYTVVATITGTGCTNNMTGSAVVTANPLPTAFTLSGGGSYCSATAGVTVNLSGSESGVSYQLYSAGSPAGSPVAGTGSAISFTGVTTGGTLTAIATNTVTACSNTMSGSATVTILPLPPVHNVTGGGSYCTGGTGVHIILDNSELGINYQLYFGSSPVGGLVAGTFSAIDMGVVTAVGTYTVSATNASTGCTRDMNGSATVSTIPLPVTQTMTGGGAYCAGGGGVPVGLANSETDVNYQLFRGSSAVGTAVPGTTGSVITFGLQTVAGTYSVIGTNAVTSCTVNMLTTVNVTVNPLPSAITGTASVCPTTTTTLNSTPGGGTWSSSNTALATVGSSGIVTGVAAGLPVITYTLGTGCITTITVTVNSTPPSITGASSVCISSTTTLTDALGGGTWSSSNTGVATIGSASGVVSPVSGPATTVITYTATTGCTTSSILSVNTLPGTIGGSLIVCTGFTTTLTDGGGGTWASGNTLIATANSSTGVVGGVSAGTANITYTLGTGCTAIAVVTVSTTPGPISGINRVCSGLTTTLSDGTSGGTWSSSNTAQASVGSSSGIVTGGTGGTTPTITYTMGTGCFVTYPITVNAVPTFTGGSTSVCTGSTTTLVVSPAGGTWSSSNTALATVGTSGIVTGVAVGNPTINYTLSTGCLVAIPVTVNQTPAAITGTRVVCTRFTTTLSDATPGGVWTSVSTAIATVGSTGIVGGVASGTSGIIYTMPTGCLSSAIVTVNASPSLITGTVNVCVGFTTALGSAPAGGTWSSNNTAQATVGTSGIVTGVAVGVPVISYTSANGCYSSTPVTVNLTPAPVTGTRFVCTGFTTFLSDATSGGVWSSTSPAQGTVSAIGIVTGVSAGTTTISYTTGSGCAVTAIVTVNSSPSSISASGGVTGIISTIAGTGISGISGDGGPATAAQMGPVYGVIADGSGNTYISDGNLGVVRKINSSGIISTVAGNGSTGFGGDGGPATAATFSSSIRGITLDGSGNLFIADWGNNRVRKVSSSGIVTTVAGNGSGAFSGDGVAATSTGLSPFDVVTDGSGNLYIADINNSRVRKVNTAGIISTIAGSASAGFGGDGGPATAANISLAAGLAFDGSGNLYISDNGNNRIRKVNTSGIISTFAGNGTAGSAGDGGPAISANLDLIYGLATDVAGNVYVADYNNGRVREINTAGIIKTVVGTSVGFSGDGGPATAAAANPAAVSVDAAGNILIGDWANLRARKVNGPQVCVGATITLTEAVSGGVWSSSNTSVATVGTSGVVTGASAGSVTIAYTMPSGCATTISVVVNPLPPAITGNANICLGLTSTLSDGVSGGTWTSLSTGIATVGSATGVVGGVALGNSTIVYTLTNTGCATSRVVTVNPQPAIITGSHTVCTGATTTLSDATGGGTWSSSNTALATIGTGGVVTGVVQGTLTIIYTLPGGCTSTYSFTVNPTPAAISGPNAVCEGSFVSLTDATAGGIWSSTSTAQATVGSLTGAVTGVAAGTTNIVYTLPAGCTAVLPMTVNPLPTPITPSGFVCVGLTTALSAIPAGGTWSSSNTALATVGTAGVVTGVAAGVANITYTVPTSCLITIPVTVNALPTVYTVTGGGSFCAGSTGVHVGLSGSSTGISYQLFWGVTPLAIMPGTGSSLDFGIITTAGTYTIVATNAVTGCVSNMSGNAFVGVYTVPAPFFVTGGGPYCAGGSGVTVGLFGSTAGIRYQLLYSGTPSGSPMIGTGGALNFGIRTGAGFYTVLASDTSTGCSATMPGGVTISITPLPTLYSMTGGGAYCVGGTGVHIGLSGSDNNVFYQLFNGVTGGVVDTGTGAALDFGLVTVTGTSYTIRATSLVTGCSTTMSGTLTVTTNPLPAAFTIGGGGGYCAGGTGVSVTLSGSATGISYQLYIGLSPVSSAITGTGALLNFGLQTAPGTYTALATDIITGCTRTMTGTTSVVINPLPAPFLMTGGGGFCSGGAGATIGLAGSVSGTSYQLLLAGVSSGGSVSGTGSAISFGTRTAPGIYTVLATLGSCTATMPGSLSVTVEPLPTIFAVTGGGSYCAGGTGVHVGLSNSTIGVNYQLFYGGSIVGTPVAGTGLPLDFGLQTNSGLTYTVVATDALTLCTSNMSGSASITINALPTAFTVSGGGSYCAGGTGLHILLSNSTTGVTYQLMSSTGPVGSPIAGSTGTSLDFGLITAGGSYTIVGTNTATTCTSTMSGAAVIVVSPLPTAYPVGGGGSLCVGAAGVNVTLGGSDTGTTYQLFRSATLVGTSISGTGSPINFGPQTVGGTYTVVATNAITHCTNSMTGSATVTVNPLPVAWMLTGGGSYCPGGAGVHIGLASSGTSGISYQLYFGLLAVGSPLTGTGGALDFGLFTSTGTYTVVATNLTTLCTNTMTGSVAVSTSTPPAIYTITGGGDYCSGGAGVLIGLSLSESGVSYQLYNGATPSGLSVAGSGSPVSFGLRTAGGSYTVIATNTATTCTSNMAGTVSVTIDPLPTAYNVSVGGSYCSGGTGVDITISGSDTGASYQLFSGGGPVGAAVTGTGAMLDLGMQTGAGSYTVVATNPVTGCTNNMAGAATVSINPLPTAFSVLGGGSYCAGLTGVDISLSGSQLGVRYQLFKGLTAVGSPVAGSGAVIDFGLQAAAGIYTVVATNVTTGCSNTMTGSSSVSISLLPTAYTVTGGGAYCAGDTGLHVTLNGSNTGISYQLYRGMSPVGTVVPGTGSPLDFGLQTVAGIYTISATDMSTSCPGNMSGSVSIAINPLPAVFAVTGGGSYCVGGAGLNVGLSGSVFGVSYQLYKDGVPNGSAMAGTGSALNFGIHTDTGVYTVIATKVTTSCTSHMSGAATISVNALPTVYIVSGSGSYCAGGDGLHVNLDNSDAGINYQLFNGITAAGSAVAGTGSPLDFGLQTLAGLYTVVATNGTTTCTMTMADSALISVNLLPTAYAVLGGGSYCAGGAGRDISITGSNVGISYQVYKDTSISGAPVAGTGFPLDLSFETLTGTYTVVAINNTTGCTRPMTGSASVSVDPVPLAYIVTGGGSYCLGGAGNHVLLSGSNSGINYQLFNGSTPVGSSVHGVGGVIDFGAQTVPGVYIVVATNATTGCTNNMLGSAANSLNPLPVIYTVTGGGNYCSGTGGVAIGLSGSNIGISYQLYLGAAPYGSPVAGTGAAISFGSLPGAGTYTVAATNDTTGCTRNMTGSATIAVTPLPLVYSVTGGGSYCIGGTGYHVGLSGSNTGISYQLYIGGGTPVGSPVAGTGSAIDFGIQDSAGTYTVVAMNTSTSCLNNMSGSVAIVINPLPTPYNLSGGGSYCAGGTGVTVGMLTSNSGISYQLYHAGAATGSAVTGTGSPISFGLQTLPGSYTVVATNVTTACTNNMIDTVTVSITPTVTPSVTISTGADDTVCSGSTATFTAMVVNGGASPSYNWSVNGSSAGTSSTYSYSPANHDTVSVTITSDAVCPSPATASNSMIVTVLDTVRPSVSITASPGSTVCQGINVTFTASSVSGGSAPVYSWTRNGAPAGTTSSINFMPDNGDVVFCTVNSNYRCRLANSAVSNNIVMVVETAASPVVTITNNPGVVSNGFVYSDTFTATVANPGLSPVFQWSVNGSIVPGANTARFIADSLFVNDVVGCVVTNVGPCGTLVGSNSTVITINNVGVKQVVYASGDIRLVPNPNKGIFTIKGTLATTQSEEVSVEITDMLGQVIYRTKVMTHNGTIDETIKLSSTLANGMYLLNVSSASDNKVFHMVVEQ